MSNEPSESSTNFSMDSSSGSGNIHEPLLDLVNSLLNSTSNSNNFIINTPALIVSTSNITPPEQDFNNNDVSTNEEPNQTIGITPQTVPLLHSIPDGNSLIDFLNFVETTIITPSPINNPQQTDDEVNTEPTSNESDTETLPLRSTRHRLAMRSINRNRNRQSGVFFQQFMTRLMDNADEQILQQVMHESFVEDQEKRLIDQARELDIEKDKYDKNNKILENFSTCRICFSEYKDGEEIGVLPCNHFFHSECIQEWGKRRPVCPFCEIDIPTVNDQAAKKQKTS